MFCKSGILIFIFALSLSSVLAWRIPGTGEPGGLPSMGSQRVRQDWVTELNWLKTVYMPTPCWLKHLCSIKALVPMSCFLSLSLSLKLFPWSAEALWVHFPARASKTLSRRRSAPSPNLEGTWGLRQQSKPRAGALLAFCVNEGISASFSLLYFLIGRLWTTRFRSIKGPQHECMLQMELICI